MAIDRPAVEYLYERGSRDGTSFRDSFGPDETNSVAKFFTNWDDRYNAVLAFLGYSAIERDASNDPVRLNRLTPLRHPDIASAVNGAGHLYATRVPSVTGHKFTTKRSSDQLPGAELNQFFRAELEVYFEHVPYGVLEDDEIDSPATEYQRFTSIEGLQPSADYFMLPGGTLMYVKDGGGSPTGQRIPFNVGKVMPMLEMKVRWHSLPFDLYAPLDPGPWFERMFGDGTTRGWIGTVNSDAVFGHAPGTVLFSALDLIPRRLPLIGLAWDVVFTLAIDVNRHNFKYYWNTSGGSSVGASGFYFVGKDETFYEPGVDAMPDDHSIYDERDLLSGLFNVAEIV